jgi:hypothetical protein
MKSNLENKPDISYESPVNLNIPKTAEASIIVAQQ